MSLQRRPRRAFALAPLGALMIVSSLAACGGGDQTGAQAQATASNTELPAGHSTSTALLAQPVNTEGRLLASNCFQCHGTLGLGGFEKIRGSEASEVLEFMTKTASKDIMAAHAQGYTTEQLKKIIAYLQR